MNITYSEPAITQIERQAGDKPFELKLVYDSEGCGCSVSGVATLWLVEPGDTKDLKAGGTPFEARYEQRHEIFFDHELSVDFTPERQSFVLKSSSQIYSNRMRLVDKRA
ncbi:iron-sulfur cluster biosynthesis family protein [Paenibacillus sp. y28]|uniref:iron-sulfur cluster biosynthesis family protein n=1 Tax=Paenibacillus sp. y28 TaxID=3129110 RepID=UPI003019CE24